MNLNAKRAALLAWLSVCVGSATGAEVEAAAQRVSIVAIEVSGNSLVSQAEIDRVLMPYRGQRTVPEMQAAAAAVQDLYRQAGYGAVVAFLPEQPLGGGKLMITVVEGKVAQVVVSGNRQFSADNVRRSLPIVQEGRTPEVRKFDTAVQLANESPARQLAVTLEEGQKRGDVDVRIAVIEDAVQHVTVSADNTGSAQTGRTRLTAGYTHAALSERDDQLSAQVQVSPERPEAVRVFSLGYRLPVYSTGLMLQAYTTYSNVVAAPAVTAAGNVNFSGNGRVLGFEATRFLERAGEFEQRASISLEKRDYLNSCAIQGLPEGACGSAGASVTVHPLSLGYENLRKGGRPAGLSVTLSSNLALGGPNGSAADFEAVRAGARRSYQVVRASAFGSLPIGANWQLNFRGTGQATGASLVPGEQFGLASVGVVRGYEEREVTGDSGLAGSFEVLTPLLMATAPGDTASGLNDLRFLAFADLGMTRNRGDLLNCNGLETRCRLSSVGLGTRFQLGRSRWRIDLARANSNARITASGDVRLHFAANIAFP